MISRFAKSLLIVTLTLLVVTMVAFLHPPSRSYMNPWTGELFGEGGVEMAYEESMETHGSGRPPISGVEGGVIMSKLGNETAKAALGRATWKLLHTMTLRFPVRPTLDEREALNSYLHLTSRLYPCGECAAEFQDLLKRFPPQTSSRRSVSLWLCSVHNEVNKRLQKAEFDCAHLDDEYDCGCGDAPNKDTPSRPDADPMDLERESSRDEVTGANLIKGGR